MSNKFESIKSVYDSLPEKQKKFVSPSGRFVDSPYSRVRVLLPNNDGFSEVYEFKPGEGFITMAIKPNKQGAGLGKQLLEQTVKEARKKKLKRLIYEACNNNSASIRFAEKNIGTPNAISNESSIWNITL